MKKCHSFWGIDAFMSLLPKTWRPNGFVEVSA